MEGESTGRDNWNWGGEHFRGKVETSFNGNSQESLRVTLTKTPNNEGYGA